LRSKTHGVIIRTTASEISVKLEGEIMYTKSKQVSRSGGCAGVECTQVRRIVPGGWPDVEIIGVGLTTLDWNTDNDVPGIQGPVNLGTLDRELLAEIRDKLGL
jgi:hypothetical protein